MIFIKQVTLCYRHGFYREDIFARRLYTLNSGHLAPLVWRPASDRHMARLAAAVDELLAGDQSHAGERDDVTVVAVQLHGEAQVSFCPDLLMDLTWE